MATSLLTGFPGFIGRRLARALLDADESNRVVALVEERMRATAEQVAAGHERLEIVTGDITDRRLGLPGADYDRLAGEVTHVHHLAAVYDLAVPLEVAERVNVDGTGNVLDFCLAASRLERLAYVSTAYVAGRRTGVVYEHELVMGQTFKNHYESTKFQAEVWVRELMNRVPTTILRPAIVVGDSRTGETEKFDGPYYMLRAIARSVKKNQPIVQFGAADAPFNVVPVDFVVDAIAWAGAADNTLGETLHLVDPEPITAHEIMDLLAQTYAGRPTKGRVPPRLIETALRVPAVSGAFGGTPRESIEYLNHSVRFDTRRAVDLLTPLGLKPPVFSDYVENLVRFFREHEDDL
jgi:thioester reductase-like protein